MKVSEQQPVTDSDVADAAERLMRSYLVTAKTGFELAMDVFADLHLDPNTMSELWFRFNATERRLMKDREGKEWSWKQESSDE